jgi:hypothetical protein
MPERQRGRDPDKQPRKEQRLLLPEYYQAARFPDEPTSNTAYEETRQALYETPCDLSTYRTILLPHTSWHVIVLGGMPDEVLRERIDRALLHGEVVELPEDVWAMFNLRRLEQSTKGKPWIERRTPRRRIR